MPLIFIKGANKFINRYEWQAIHINTASIHSLEQIIVQYQERL